MFHRTGTRLSRLHFLPLILPHLILLYDVFSFYCLSLRVLEEIQFRRERLVHSGSEIQSISLHLFLALNNFRTVLQGKQIKRTVKRLTSCLKRFLLNLTPPLERIWNVSMSIGSTLFCGSVQEYPEDRKAAAVVSGMERLRLLARSRKETIRHFLYRKRNAYVPGRSRHGRTQARPALTTDQKSVGRHTLPFSIYLTSEHLFNWFNSTVPCPNTIRIIGHFLRITFLTRDGQLLSILVSFF